MLESTKKERRRGENIDAGEVKTACVMFSI